jgi:SAM-dependent methyltransferase
MMVTPGSYDEYAFVAGLYDHVTPYRNRQDVAFFVEMARRSSGPVLEVGCGTGRVLLPTARAGIEITGLDSSSSMLSVCREKLSRSPQDVQAKVQLFQADMRQFDLGREFYLITIPFRPFQHLITVEDQLSCLNCLHRHLAHEGRLILDLFNPSLKFLVDDEASIEMLDVPEFVMPDGRKVARYHRIASRDLFNQIQEVELIYYVTHTDGRVERLLHVFPMRYLFKFEVEHLLARCGFQVEHVYADYDWSLYGSKYPGELIFVAKKISHRGTETQR